MDRILQFVEDNYANKEMCVSYAAQYFGISNKRLGVLFGKQTGVTFGRYVEKKRLRQAEKYLLETDWCIARISEEVGYNTIDAFYKAFKKTHGTAPGKWRRSGNDFGAV